MGTKSERRVLSKKVLCSLLTAGVCTVMFGMPQAWAKTLDVTGGSSVRDKSGISATAGQTVTSTEYDTISINSGSASGIYATGAGAVINLINGPAIIASTTKRVDGIHADTGAAVTISGGSIDITISSGREQANGVYASGTGTTVTLSDVALKNVTADRGAVTALYADAGATIVYKNSSNNKGTINVKSTNTSSGITYGLYATGSDSKIQADNVASIVVNSAAGTAKAIFVYDGASLTSTDGTSAATIDKLDVTSSKSVVGLENNGIAKIQMNDSINATITGSSSGATGVLTRHKNSATTITGITDLKVQATGTGYANATGIYADLYGYGADYTGVTGGVSNITSAGGDLIVTNTSTTDSDRATGISAYDMGQNIVNGFKNISVSGTASSVGLLSAHTYVDPAWGIEQYQGSVTDQSRNTVTLAGGDLKVTVTAADRSAWGLDAEGYSTNTLNGVKNIDVEATDAAGGDAVAVGAWDNGTNNVNMTGEIIAKSTNGEADGVWSDTGTTTTVTGFTGITAAGKTLSYALAAYGGTINATGADAGFVLAGQVYADNAGVINLSGKTTFDADKVSFTSANSGAINLIGGAMDGVLKIDTGAVNVAGAALTTHDFSKITPEKGLVLNSGSLTTTSGLIFANGIDTTSDDTVLASKDSGAISNTKVALNSGSLILDDSKYSVDYVSTASAALKNAGSTTLTMAGTLVNGTTAVTTITPEAASAIGNNVALDKVTVKNDGNNLVVGTSTTPSTTTEDGVTLGSTTTVAKNGFGAKALDLGAGSTGAIITNNQNVTLGGSEGGDVLLADGKTDSNLKLVVGANELLGDATNTTGSLTLGNALVTKDTTLNLTGSVTINNGSSLTVNGNTTVTDGISAGGGNIAVGTGTLNTALELTGGNNTLTGTANLSSLTSTPDAVLEIGTTGATSQVSIANANLNGATLIFDPAWTEPAAQNAISYSGDIDSLTAIGSNEYVTIGSTDTTEAATMFANTGLTFGEGNVESVLYLKGNQTLSGTSGSLTVNGTTASAAGNFTANANSLTMVDGSATVSGTAALSGVTSTSISDSAKLYINSATTGNTYTILAGNGITQGWTNANILTNNKLVSFTGTVSDTSFIVNSTVNSVADVFGGAIIAPNVVNNALGTSGTAAYAFLNKTVDSNVYSTAAGTVNAINSLANLGELGGVQHGAYTVGNTFADMVNDHLSFAGHDRAEHDVWAQYIHNKETVSNMSLGGLEGSYDLKYNGVVVGSDLYIRNNTTAGVAVMYADGDISGAMTKNDAKYYGVSLYGRQTNGRTNILADVTYMHGTNDLKQTNTGTEITASPKIDTFSLGVKAEQRYSKGNTSIVPYVGARYLHIGAAKYTNNLGFNYDPEDQNLFLIPIGVKVFGEIKANDWTFRPKAQLGYVWTLGNRNPSQTISYNGVNDEFSYNTADSGYFLGGLGFEAEHKNVAYALNYQYKKGSSTKNNIWMAQVRFAF